MSFFVHFEEKQEGEELLMNWAEQKKESKKFVVE